MKGANHDTRLVILDRDGVINRDSDAFVKSVAEWLPLPGSIDAIARLSKAGFTVAIASNQSGISRGLFGLEALEAMHTRLHELVRAAGGAVDRIEICPHGPDDGCDCRKPAPGLLRKLAAHYGVTLAGVPVIGDAARDLEAAIAVGARPILVRTGKGAATENALPEHLRGVEICDDLAAAADRLTRE